MGEGRNPGRRPEDVARYYLSDILSERAGENPQQAVTDHSRRVHVCAPGSSAMAAFFLANLSLELARNRYPVIIHDPAEDGQIDVRALMMSVADQHTVPGILRVSLYGLPEILITRGEQGAEKCLGNSCHTSTNVLDTQPEYVRLIGVPGSIDHLRGVGQGSYVMMVSRQDDMSLLQCYAYVKVLAGKDPGVSISLVLDESEDSRTAHVRFQRFSDRVFTKCGVSIRYLGSLVHDACLGLSMVQGKPLVLFQDASSSKEQVISIAQEFLSWSGHVRGEGHAR
ncbi:MAG: MinD/ParA family ATP-binding protein [Desulfomonilia bacterium]